MRKLISFAFALASFLLRHLLLIGTSLLNDRRSEFEAACETRVNSERNVTAT
jgi:hypothetical protein